MCLPQDGLWLRCPQWVCVGDLHLSPSPLITLQLRLTCRLPREGPGVWEPQSRGWRGTRTEPDSEGCDLNPTPTRL